MATINIAITYPDANQTRVITALRAHYGPIADPPGSSIVRQRTPAECVAAFVADSKDRLKSIITQTEANTARITAEAGIADPSIT